MKTYVISSEMYLIAFVEEETEICKNDPQFLPAARVLELAQQESTQLVLHVTVTCVTSTTVTLCQAPINY